MARSEVASLTGITGSGCGRLRKKRNSPLMAELNRKVHFIAAPVNGTDCYPIRLGPFSPPFRYSLQFYLSWLLSGSRSLTCLVKTMRPSRKGGTRLCTIRCTLAALSSSKSSSTSSRWTTPLVSMRLVSQRSLSCDDTTGDHAQTATKRHPERSPGKSTHQVLTKGPGMPQRCPRPLYPAAP